MSPLIKLSFKDGPDNLQSIHIQTSGCAELATICLPIAFPINKKVCSSKSFGYTPLIS